MSTAITLEHERLAAHTGAKVDWKLWGPYLAERAWGTVREDYSAGGHAWDYFSHEDARSRAYRWNEDGLAGICDAQQRLCLALALWNGRDPILKERLFGLTGPQGNHGEDVKEAYFYLDNTPTHSYMQMLYKYPQALFPYQDLVAVNSSRGRDDPEYELMDTGVFDADRYFDVFVEYAKAGHEDILMRVSAVNRGPEAAELSVLPTAWFRNTWAWGRDDRRGGLRQGGAVTGGQAVGVEHFSLGRYVLCFEGQPELLFTENETNAARLFGAPNSTPYVKDAFHEAVIHGRVEAVNPGGSGTKVAGHYRMHVAPGEAAVVRVRLVKVGDQGAALPRQVPFAEFDAVFDLRRAEADAFYAAVQAAGLDEDQRRVQRQALAGMLWSKQFYHYDVDQWLAGDPALPPPPAERWQGRNAEWTHVNNADIISMPDKWEYPWFAAWDLAFHCVPLALVDGRFAKDQLVLLLREWYQHPNGQVPAYEWSFGDVNPPVFAWAAWRVYKIDRKVNGAADRAFLERVFHKLLLNFTWWVNKKDAEGKNVFQGGFLGLDNIGLFDRSAALPDGGHLEQSDGTAWMGMFSLHMMTIALELALENPVYEDIATKFFEHFLYIAKAINHSCGAGQGLWNEEDEFFYDVLHLPNGDEVPLKVRSLVGLIPLLAVETIEPAVLDRLPDFKRRMEWFLNYRPDLAALVSRWYEPGAGERRLVALVRGHRMKRLLARMLDPAEFLSDHGVRSLSRYHLEHPYGLDLGGQAHMVGYEPAESRSGLFGGNSNWRGPVWFPINYLLIEALQKFHHYYGDDFLVESPSGSGQFVTLDTIADGLAGRLTSIFTRDEAGRRVFNGVDGRLQTDPHWCDYILFHEYFDGDTGLGLGAGHQTGWTGLVAKLLDQQGKRGEKAGMAADREMSAGGAG